MGGGVSSLISKSRYIGGKTYYKFFNEDVWPVMEEIFERLRVTQEQSFKVFHMFAIIDSNEDGMIGNAQIFNYIKLLPNKFTERLFFIETRDRENNIIVHQHLQQSEDEKKDLQSYTEVFNESQIRKELFFQEFFLRLWHFNTLSAGQLAQSLFEVFDIDHEYKLHKSFLPTMFKMLYNTQIVDPEYFKFYDDIIDEKTQEFSKDDFMSMSAIHTELIQPILFFQKKLRGSFGSTLLWSILQKLRQQYFSTYDENANTLDESLMAIIQSSYHVSTKAKKSKKNADNLLRQKSQKIRITEETIEQEVVSQQLYKEALETASLQNNVFYKEMMAMKEQFLTFQKKMEEEEFLTHHLDRRAKRRAQLYQHYDTYKAKALQFYELANEKEIEITEGNELDHDRRYMDYIVTEEGKIIYDLTFYLYFYERLVQYYNEKLLELEQKGKNTGKGVSALKEKQFTAITNFKSLKGYQEPFIFMNYVPHTKEKRTQNIIRYKTITARDYREDERICKDMVQNIPSFKPVFTTQHYQAHEFYRHALISTKEFLYQEVKTFTFQFCKERIENVTKERNIELLKLEIYIVNTFGSRITKYVFRVRLLACCYRLLIKIYVYLCVCVCGCFYRWEYLLDKEMNRYLYINRDTKERRHPKTALCEKCDAIMVQHELRCDNCLAPRSQYNMKLYRPLGFKDLTLE